MKKINDMEHRRSDRKRIPSLKAIRAFEAVAHHLSFTKAADELSVSQGAVSHQIKLLEEKLGVRVFVRGKTGVSLTPQGILLKETCKRALDEISETLSLIRRIRDTKTLNVSAGPFFALKVIAPRISDFMNDNPGLQLHLNNVRSNASSPGPNDVFIEYCDEAPAGTHSFELLREKLVPVCSGDLIKSVENPMDLLRRPDITRLNYRDLKDWESWLGQEDIETGGDHPNLVFDDQHTIIEVVRSGQGIALADRSLIDQDVNAGRIFVISESYIRPPLSYKFVCAEDIIAATSYVDVFRKWLMDEIAEIQALSGGS
ncbi:LysR family transcriptional regulator [Stappia stellulata]|uniref:LysR family transcriptional regulator n=1 Tax=Stappia stellulata TaxID=71235 RepID=UPI00048D7CF7|nr:LysR family transcriptional regulator [Stappia stellulata]